jgi:hypothetical protein
MTAQRNPPISPAGDALFSVTNSTGEPSDRVFVQVVGRDDVENKDFFARYSPDGTFKRYFPVPGEDSSPFAYSLSRFSNGSLYLPAADGTRLYVSVGGPVKFTINSTINSPDPHNPADPSNSLLWDKIEFNISDAAIFVNPTAVDSFCLPIRIKETLKSGETIEGGATFSRSEAFSALSKSLSTFPWDGLFANDDRVVLAPNDGARTGRFPKDFLETTGWLDAFYGAFSAFPLSVDMDESFPPSSGGGVWRGVPDASSRTIVLRRDVDSSHPAIDPILLGVPSEIQDWLSGTGGAWKADTELKRAIVRNVSAAFDANVLFTNEPLGKRYFSTVKKSFYQTNPSAPKNLDFVDEYSKALHSIGDGKLYTVPYDDELDQCGAVTCHPSEFASGEILFGPL